MTTKNLQLILLYLVCSPPCWCLVTVRPMVTLKQWGREDQGACGEIHLFVLDSGVMFGLHHSHKRLLFVFHYSLVYCLLLHSD